MDEDTKEQIEKLLKAIRYLSNEIDFLNLEWLRQQSEIRELRERKQT